MRRRAAALVLAVLAACQPASFASASETRLLAPQASRIAHETPGLKQAIFAGGCFWGVEGVFSHVAGVTSAVSGYHGGTAQDASYEQVSSGTTDHAEAVRVTYDPAKVRYDQLLRLFFSVATDPTQLDRQGPDHGRQYRNALVPLSAEQRAAATAYLAQMRASGLWGDPIVTRIETARRFYPAEARHQDFMADNPRNPYVQRWDAPKLEALRTLFPALYQRSFTRG